MRYSTPSLALACSLALLAGCDRINAPPESRVVAPPESRVASLEVTGAPALLPPGFVAQLAPIARDSAGAVVSGVNVQWSSDAPDLATISQDGVVAAIGGHGTVTITARSGQAAGQVFLEVAPLPGKLAVENLDGATLSATIWIFGFDGSPPTRIGGFSPSPVAFDRMPAWSPDGSQLAFTCALPNRWGICVVASDGRETVIGAPADPQPVFAPEWSPDGTAILFTNFPGGLSLIDPNGSNLRAFAMPVLLTSAWPGGGRFSPDGTQLAFESYINYYDDRDLCVLRIDQQQANCLGGGYDPAWSPNETNLLAFALDSHLLLMASDGSGLHTVYAGPDVVRLPAWSPDGQWIAFERFQPIGGGRSTWLIRADGTNLVRLGGPGTDFGSPAWGR